MDDVHHVAEAAFEEARGMLRANVVGLGVEEWLDTGGGYRSVLGLMKHVAAWTAIYHSFAFDAAPRHWDDTDWPRGLIGEIDPSEEYAKEVVAWFERSCDAWTSSLDAVRDLGERRRAHWGEELPLRKHVAIVTHHIAYHAGEMNMILAIRRGEAFEFGEQVEENHISTVGHRVRRGWMSDEFVERHST